VYGIGARILRSSIRKAGAAVIACSNSVLEPIRNASRNVHVIPNGVRDAGFHEREFGRDGRLRIGIVGRIAPDKGQLEFVGAARILAGQFPEARFVICGAPMLNAPPEYLEAVRERARGLPVEFLPWQPDIGRVLQEVDLLAVPSKREGMARIIVESFSAGVPVVAFPAGGIPEVIEDGETGFLTREFTAVALAGRICEITASPANLSRAASKARRAWEQSYTVAAYQQRVIRLLEQLAQKPSRRALPAEAKTPEPQLRR
jgi:glycosyltransferase involved in cell wall biosynthesis